MRWFLARKVEFFPFEVFLVNEAYKYGNPALKWHFKNLFFYYINGYEYSFRAKKDMEDLRKFLNKNLDEKFVKRVGKEIRDSADELKRITNLDWGDKNKLKKGLDLFCKAYIRMLSVFQIPALVQIVVPNKDKKLLIEFGMYRDYAAKIFSEVDKIFPKKMSKVLGMPKETALMMLPDEVKHYLERGELPKDFEKRKTCAILTLNGKTKVYWNKEANKVFYEEYKKYKKKGERDVKGEIAYKGLVRGKAYVAANEKEFQNIPKNSILICSMTRYNIVPYMKKVKGIVTDQGGVTCHAAIISRELKVPTLVGTRKATEVFKTGDKVEVDCNKGVIKKIK